MFLSLSPSLTLNILTYPPIFGIIKTNGLTADKAFAKKLDFKGLKFSVNVRDIHKMKKKEFYWH